MPFLFFGLLLIVVLLAIVVFGPQLTIWSVNTLLFGLLIVVLLAIVVFGPLLTIWSVNTLFGFTIPYTLKTWLASIVLSGVFGGAKYVKQGSN
jgi:hypothetical protein